MIKNHINKAISFQAHGHNTIHATLVCPYYINTGMFDGVTPRLMPMLEPDYVAETMIDSIRKNEVNCIMPGSVRYLLPLKWLVFFLENCQEISGRRWFCIRKMGMKEWPFCLCNKCSKTSSSVILVLCFGKLLLSRCYKMCHTSFGKCQLNL